MVCHMKQNYIYIPYHINRLKSSIYLTRFLQISGYQVFSERMDVQLFSESEEDFDISMILSPESEYDLSEVGSKNEIILTKSELDGYEEVAQIINELEDKCLIETDTSASLKFVYDVFRENQLALHEYNCDYYFFDKDVNQSAYEAYDKAVRSMDNYLNSDVVADTDIDILRLQYAKYYLEKRKLEKLKDLDNEIKDEIEDIFGKLLELLRKDEQFVSVYMLIGDALILNLANTNTAMDYYNKYFMKAQKNRCASAVYYRCGRVLEIRSGGLKRAYKAYYLSNNIDHNNYRAAYKLALYYTIVEDDTDKVLELYGKIINTLTDLQMTGYIQPIEIEYLFKTLFICGKYYVEYLKSYSVALPYFERTEKLMNIRLADLKFLQEMYGTDAQKYFDSIIDRFPVRQVEINKQFALASE